MTSLVFTFCALLITCAILVVQSANPVYSVLYLILAFFNASACVLLCGHDYMAALFVVLYVGAMCTFFLFAIMILDIKVDQAYETLHVQTPVNAVVACVFALMIKNIFSAYDVSLARAEPYIQPLSAGLLDRTSQIYSLGAVLYTCYAMHLILAGLILLCAMLGSIALTLNKSTPSKTQQIYTQNLRDFRRGLVKHV